MTSDSFPVLSVLQNWGFFQWFFFFNWVKERVYIEQNNILSEDDLSNIINTFGLRLKHSVSHEY